MLDSTFEDSTWSDGKQNWHSCNTIKYLYLSLYRHSTVTLLPSSPLTWLFTTDIPAGKETTYGKSLHMKYMNMSFLWGSVKVYQFEITHHEWPWCKWRRQHQRSMRRLSPCHTCTTQSLPPSGCSWSHWTPGGPGRRKHSLCPQLDWPNGCHLFELSWCRTPSCAPDTSILHSWRTEAHKDTGLWGIDPPGPWALSQWSPRRDRLMESGDDWMLNTSLNLNFQSWCSQNRTVTHSGYICD